MLLRITKKQKFQVKRAAEVYFLMNEILAKMQKVDKSKEHLWVIGLKRNNEVNYIQWVDWVSMGSASCTIADPSQIFKTAIIKNASGIIICHNHPSGNKKPSEHDIALTKKIASGGLLLDIALLDHIIFTTDAGYFSFAEEDQM